MLFILAMSAQSMSLLEDTDKLHRITAIIQFFVALGAIGAGFTMIIEPDGSLMGMEEFVDRIPFTSLLIPGILLFTVNGLGQMFAGILSLKKHKLSAYTTAFFGFGLVIWIIVQVIMFGGGIHWLQTLYFSIGLVEIVLAYLIYRKI